MKLWEAPLSSSILADIAPNKTYSYRSLCTEGHKTPGKETKTKNEVKFYLYFYATLVPLFRFLGKFA